MLTGSSFAIQTGRVLFTLCLVLAAEVAAASLVIFVNYSLLKSKSYYPWGYAIGGTSGEMMVPAIIIWFFSLFRLASLFIVASVLVICVMAFLVYQGSALDASRLEAIIDAFLHLLGGAVAITVIALRMRGRWKPKHT